MKNKIANTVTVLLWKENKRNYASVTAIHNTVTSALNEIFRNNNIFIQITFTHALLLPKDQTSIFYSHVALFSIQGDTKTANVKQQPAEAQDRTHDTCIRSTYNIHYHYTTEVSFFQQFYSDESFDYLVIMRTEQPTKYMF